ncbi:MAG: glycosyltransferase family 10 domain-containing protein [Chloroflexota bacterium]
MAKREPKEVSNPRGPVALAIRNPDLQKDRIFELVSDGPVDQAPYTPWRRVRQLAAEHGITLVTADRVSQLALDPRSVTVLAYDWPPAAQALVAAGARPGVLTSLEPPVIAWELYYRLPKLSAGFPIAFLFGGAAERIAPGCTFRQLLFPQVRQVGEVAWPDWSQRRFLVSIVANKAVVRSFTRWFDQPREVSVKRELASRRYPPLASDLYVERLRAIAHFAGRTGFDTFGQGWERRHPAAPARLHAAFLRSYQGPAPLKLATLAQYRFALCLENSIFPGYISEKIFDCFFAGTVPLYLGAPDVHKYIPADAFVDLRQFRNYSALEQFLDSLEEARVRRYVDAATDFLNSPAFTKFSHERFASDMVEALRSLPELA